MNNDKVSMEAYKGLTMVLESLETDLHFMHILVNKLRVIKDASEQMAKDVQTLLWEGPTFYGDLRKSFRNYQSAIREWENQY